MQIHGSWKNIPMIANMANLPFASSALSFFLRTSGSAMPLFLRLLGLIKSIGPSAEPLWPLPFQETCEYE
jgi:hypothetical protein